MKFLIVGLVMASGLIPTASAFADDGASLASSKCMSCHAVDQKKVGPSFKDIAAKYAGKSDAPASLVAELKNGKGHPKIAGTDADLSAVIDYVLSIK